MNLATVAAVYAFWALVLMATPAHWALVLFLAAAVTPGVLVVWLSIASFLAPVGQRGKYPAFVAMTDRVLLDGAARGRRRKAKGWL